MAVRRMLVAGRYRLHEPVGTGGMGRVWMARDEMLDRDVAVKEFVPPDWMTDDEKERLRDRTLREARSAARLNHPHVVRIYDVVHADDLPWIVMEYVPSRSLHQVITEDGPFVPRAAARIGLDVLSALTAAHRAGVLHRDVKPHNVLIGTDGRVVLTDFGLATFVDDGSITGPGLVVGSPQYVSPERARDGASTVESDLWSLGATLYAAVEGRSPYARENAMATLTALATERPDPPVLAGPLMPVLIGLLRHEPAERLTARQTEDWLRAIVADRTAPRAGNIGGRAYLNGRAVVPAQRTPADPVKPPRALAEAVKPAEPGADRDARRADRAGRGANREAPGTNGEAPGAEREAPATDRNASPATAGEPMTRRNQPPAAAKPPVPPAGLTGPSGVLSPPRQAVPEKMDEVAPAEGAEPRQRRARFATLGLIIFALLAAGGVTGAILQRGDGHAAPAPPPIISAGPAGRASGEAAGGPGGFSPIVCQQKPAPNLPRTPQRGASRDNPKDGYELFPGYSIYTDPQADFRLAVPDGWTYERIGTTVCFRDPGNVRLMSLDYGRNPEGNPEQACRKEADRLVAAGALPGYQELGITPQPLSIKAAEWEYTYVNGDVRMHSATRWFVNSGRGFALGWTTRDFDWSQNWPSYRMIQGTFTGTA